MLEEHIKEKEMKKSLVFTALTTATILGAQLNVTHTSAEQISTNAQIASADEVTPTDPTNPDTSGGDTGTNPDTGGGDTGTNPDTGGGDTGTNPDTGGSDTGTKPNTGGGDTGTNPDTGGSDTGTKPNTGGGDTGTKPNTGGSDTGTKPNTGGGDTGTTNPSTTNPVNTENGNKVIGVENSLPILQLADGTTKKVTPQEIGATVQKDGTLSVKAQDGTLKTLPKTGSTNGMAMSILGSLISLATGAFIFKRKTN